ncbi:MAG: GAF domain-containing protein [Dehalococcoidales bacterium]|nr:GAF domain-containing protein [Dehalococcoidales bacterium]
MRKLPPGIANPFQEQYGHDVVRQLAGQLQIANIALQDTDFDVVLEQTIQTICALHHSQMGLLLTYHPGFEPTSFPRKDVAVVGKGDLQEEVNGLWAHCSHATVLWRGWTRDLLRASRELSLSTIFGEIERSQSFVVAPLITGNRELGRILMILPGDREFGDAEMQTFSDLVAEAGRALDRARMLEQAKQRHREAEALYQTVHEISTYLELDEVLRAIVRRARDLLATDTAYLTFKETDLNEIYMRVTDGIGTPEFKAVRMMLGEGLGGLVAKLREPVFTSNYLADPRFQHVSQVDDAVSKEGILGILGVPLIVADRAIGVLFAANRRPTHFTQDNVKLLASLGNSAAVAIEKAWLYAKEREAVTKLQELNELIRTQHEMLSKSMHIHDQLAKLLLSGQGTEQIALTLANLVSNPVIVEDHLFRPIAQAYVPSSAGGKDDAVLQPLPPEALQDPEIMETIRLLSESPHPVHVTWSSDRGPKVSRVMAPIIVGQEVLGYVSVAESNKPLEELDYMILERAATILALEMARQKAALDVELRLRGDFLDEILSGKYESEHALLKRALHFGYDLTKPHQVMALAIDNLGSHVERHGASRTELVSLGRLLFDVVRDAVARRVPGSVVANSDDAVIVLIPVGDERAAESTASLANWLLDEVSHNSRHFTASAGLGRVCRRLTDYAVSWREATECLTIVRRLGKARQVLSFDELGVLRLLFRIEDKNELSAFAHQTLGQLQEYDRRHGGSLVQTLRIYLENNGNLQATAKALYIHVNTLLYRLQRIRDICQANLDHAETRLNFQIALRILELMG